MSDSLSTVSGSEEQTRALGARFGASLVGGEVIFLYGEFGAGKTVFVKGLAEALGIPPLSITSPSFTLVQSHPGKLTLFHADLYRLDGDAAIEELALGELIRPDSVLVIEWAQHWRSPNIHPTHRISFEHAGGDRRHVRFDA